MTTGSTAPGLSHSRGQVSKAPSSAPPRVPNPLGWRSWLLIGLGGALGALTRTALMESMPHEPGSFPVVLWTVNVLGCFGLGLLVYGLVRPGFARPWVRPMLGTGFLGGFTTFSAFALETETLLSDGHAPLALAYVAASIVTGVLAAAAGAWTGTFILPGLVRLAPSARSPRSLRAARDAQPAGSASSPVSAPSEESTPSAGTPTGERPDNGGRS